jgi:hypothetical protein
MSVIFLNLYFILLTYCGNDSLRSSSIDIESDPILISDDEEPNRDRKVAQKKKQSKQ